MINTARSLNNTVKIINNNQREVTAVNMQIAYIDGSADGDRTRFGHTSVADHESK